MSDSLDLRTDQRPFTIVYDDFLDSTILNEHEKLLFVHIKRYTKGKDHLQAFPSINTLSKKTGHSRGYISECIKHMEEVKVLKRERRTSKDGGNLSNLYTLYDYEGVWKAETPEEAAAAIDREEEERMIELLRAKGYKIEKEKSPVSGTDQSTETEQISENDNKDVPDTNEVYTDISDYKESRKESQYGNPLSDPEYNLDILKRQIDYPGLLVQFPCDKGLIDNIVSILYSKYSIVSKTIKVGQNEIRKEAVQAVIKKIGFYDVVDSIEKYNNITDHIRCPSEYLFKLLYTAGISRTAETTNYYNRTYKGCCNE